VDVGKVLTQTVVVADEPELQWACEPKEKYTIVMSDPDAAASGFERLHWLVINVPGKECNVKNGRLVVKYTTKPTPESGTGEHRYVFQVFKQSAEITVTSINDVSSFNSKTFATDNNLDAPAVAGNFYLVNAVSKNSNAALSSASSMILIGVAAVCAALAGIGGIRYYKSVKNKGDAAGANAVKNKGDAAGANVSPV
jgi:hypothetical protein